MQRKRLPDRSHGLGRLQKKIPWLSHPFLTLLLSSNLHLKVNSMKEVTACTTGSHSARKSFMPFLHVSLQGKEQGGEEPDHIWR